MFKSLMLMLATLFMFHSPITFAADDAHACMARYTETAKAANSGVISHRIEARGYDECYKKQDPNAVAETVVGVSAITLVSVLSAVFCIMGIAIAGRVSGEKEKRRLISALEKAESEQKRLNDDLHEALKKVDDEVAKRDQLKVALDEVSLKLKLNRTLNTSRLSMKHRG